MGQMMSVPEAMLACRESLVALKAFAMPDEPKITIADALEQWTQSRHDELAYATIDHERAARTGFPEVIFCPGKSDQQIAEIAASLARTATVVMATRASQGAFEAVRARLPQTVFYDEAHIIAWEKQPLPRVGCVAVVSAGTSDGPVAAEAAISLALMGNNVSRINDVGVAGLHRVLNHRDLLNTASAIVAVAGMDGALPAVIAGLTDKPVIATPTSVGYGASFQGIAALLAMLNSCAVGVSVVNIDNGFGAACVASRINHVAAGNDG
jgi:NCAIR mutase (PurE)-related protein